MGARQADILSEKMGKQQTGLNVFRVRSPVYCDLDSFFHGGLIVFCE